MFKKNSYRSVWVTKVDFELSHGSDDCDHTLNGVTVDHRPILQTFFL